MKQIPLRARDGSVRAYALVDDCDFEDLNRWRWSLNTGYAARGARRNGKNYAVLMHRQILDLHPGDGREGDHINRDRLDNRRENLRVATKAENRQNVASRGKTSRHRGVCWDATKGRWLAKARLSGTSHFLGYFTDELAAAAAAAEFRAERMPFAVEAG